MGIDCPCDLPFLSGGQVVGAVCVFRNRQRHCHEYDDPSSLSLPASLPPSLPPPRRSGFQTIPLLELGYDMTAIDMSEDLLQELEEHRGEGGRERGRERGSEGGREGWASDTGEDLLQELEEKHG